MEITATELKRGLGKYLEAVESEVITTTKNGKAIARLIGVKTFKYDLSELEAFEKRMSAAFRVSETPESAYDSGYAASTGNAPVPQGTNPDVWMLTHNGEPVADLSPVPKQKRKRKLGFIPDPPVSEETNAALFESEWSEEDYEKWLNEKCA
jgi:prevent-host-death family protein